MASLKIPYDSFSKRNLAYWQQGADNPPDAGPQGKPQWIDLDVSGSPANLAAVAFWQKLDVVAQGELAGKARTEEEMVALETAYIAYMDRAYVGARHDQLEWYIFKAKEQWQMVMEPEERGEGETK